MDVHLRDPAASIGRAQAKGELPAEVAPRLAGAAMFGAMRQLMVEALGRTPRVPEQTLVAVLWRQVAASVHIDPAHPGHLPSANPDTDQTHP